MKKALFSAFLLSAVAVNAQIGKVGVNTNKILKQHWIFSQVQQMLFLQQLLMRGFLFQNYLKLE